jgi:hypothetical protein
MRPPSRIAVARLPRTYSLLRKGAPSPRRDETSLRVLLWLAMIIGLLAGFSLVALVAGALAAS